MTDAKTATKPAATAKDEATTPAVEDTSDLIDMKELTHTFKVLRYRAQELVRDANRKSPVLSRSQEEARAKAVSFVKVLQEYSKQSL